MIAVIVVPASKKSFHLILPCHLPPMFPLCGFFALPLVGQEEGEDGSHRRDEGGHINFPCARRFSFPFSSSCSPLSSCSPCSSCPLLLFPFSSCFPSSSCSPSASCSAAQRYHSCLFFGLPVALFLLLVLLPTFA